MADIARLYLFPYCIKQRADGAYIVLNRKYKPIGFVASDHVTYEDFPIGFLPKKSPEVAFQGLSWDPDNKDFEQIYLYSDQCIPTKSKAYWASYANRLELLANLEVKTIPESGVPNETRHFELWLLQFIADDSPLGSLARDVQSDDSFPALNSCEAADSHLMLRSGCTEARKALQDAWKLYDEESKSPQLV
jgi:hypothetical protein